ncbi:hypothetical protein HOE425_330254 [Hoeflea sp. EC-HK425]|nr:hypothetical protein HOE425_330254 [Hoeflea sp. EC-HK425]
MPMASPRLPGDLMHADFPPAQKHLRFGVLAASALRSGQDLAQRKGGLPWDWLWPLGCACFRTDAIWACSVAEMPRASTKGLLFCKYLPKLR